MFIREKAFCHGRRSNVIKSDQWRSFFMFAVLLPLLCASSMLARRRFMKWACSLAKSFFEQSKAMEIFALRHMCGVRWPQQNHDIVFTCTLNYSSVDKHLFLCVPGSIETTVCYQDRVEYRYSDAVSCPHVHLQVLTYAFHPKHSWISRNSLAVWLYYTTRLLVLY